MRVLAWVLLVVTGTLALGLFLLLIDLALTGLTTGALYRYVGMAEVLALFLCTAYVGSRCLRFVRSQPAPGA
jgi:hypothetical protein